MEEQNIVTGTESEAKVHSWLDLAEVAFKAYNDQAGGKTWDGKDIPPFAEVGEKVQANWIAAVRHVCAAVGRAGAGDGV